MLPIYKSISGSTWRSFIFKSVLLISAFAAGYLLVNWYFNSEYSERLRLLKAELVESEKRQSQDLLLGQYAINMMYQTSAGKKISDAKKQILARAIIRISNDIFETIDHKKAFIAILAIESEFQQRAQSPTGPRGLAQVAKAAYAEGLAMCGLTGFHDDDVWETDINLYAGACYFRMLLERYNDPYIAIVAYNQGPNSKDIKTYAKYGRIENVEALKYVARFSFLKQTVSDEQHVGAPIIDRAIMNTSVKIAKPKKLDNGK